MDVLSHFASQIRNRFGELARGQQTFLIVILLVGTITLGALVCLGIRRSGTEGTALKNPPDLKRKSRHSRTRTGSPTQQPVPSGPTSQFSDTDQQLRREPQLGTETPGSITPMILTIIGGFAAGFAIWRLLPPMTAGTVSNEPSHLPAPPTQSFHPHDTDPRRFEPVQTRLDDRVNTCRFAFLHDRHPDDIRLSIDGEHPQTIALILSQLPAALSASIVSRFDSPRQADIVHRLASIGPTDEETLTEIAHLLEQSIGLKPVRSEGIPRAADLLRVTPKPVATTVIQHIDASSPALAQSIKNCLFSFQDLLTLDDETLAIALQETRGLRWAQALKGSSEKIRQRIWKQLSPLEQTSLKAEMDSTGPLRLIEISAVQAEIASAVLALDAQERVQLPQPVPHAPIGTARQQAAG